MLTVRLCDALSSFAWPGSSVRSSRLFPGRRWSAASNLFRWEKTTVVAVKIKLKRLGKIREPYYRIVVADARTKRDGRAIEEIGKYHPKAEPSFIEVDSERVQHWLSVGAQPTDPVRVLLKITGDWQKFTGEPGAEGTLRTAAPRADKKEAFAAAAKESLASKEAKESKSGSGAARDTAARGKAAKDGAAKDTATKATAKDGAAKDTATKATAKDGAAKPARGKGGAGKAAETEAAGSEAAAGEAGAAEAVAAEAVAAEAGAGEAGAGEAGAGEAVTAEVATGPAASAEGASSEEGEAANAEPGSGA
jgi:small subunit ribosomal protein S16